MTDERKAEVAQLPPSIVRTVVPYIVGAVAAQLARIGLHYDDATINVIVTVAVSSAYYAAVRYLETLRPKFGWLLGLAKPPLYPHAIDVAPVDVRPGGPALPPAPPAP